MISIICNYFSRYTINKNLFKCIECRKRFYKNRIDNTYYCSKICYNKSREINFKYIDKTLAVF